MKRIILLAVLAAVQFCSFGQNTMKFLGIPIDGSKEQMISALKNKGYTYDVRNDILEGEFNGQSVYISVQTNKNKVSRICVLNSNPIRDEATVRIRFNTLYNQFMSNGKYSYVAGKEIPDDENISHGITLYKKRYEADFIPVDKSINGTVWFMISDEYDGFLIVIFYENGDNMPNGDDL